MASPTGGITTVGDAPFAGAVSGTRLNAPIVGLSATRAGRGYWLLGRTPVRLYDPGSAEPTLLRAGDRVRMRPIDRAEYDAILARVEARVYRPVIA